MDFIKVNAKAIIGFIAVAISQSVVDAIHSGTPLPDSTQGWLVFIGLSLAGALAVWATGGKLTLDQIVNNVPKLKTTEQEAVAQKTLDVMPTPVSDKVVAQYPDWETPAA